LRNLTEDPGKALHGAGDQIDHQEQKDSAKPPRVVHIEEVEKVQYLIKTYPVSLKIFHTGSILGDERADDGKAGKKNEESDREFKGTEKIVEEGEKPVFPYLHRPFRFFHTVLDLY
jgi:hypothetical protein